MDATDRARSPAHENPSAGRRPEGPGSTLFEGPQQRRRRDARGVRRLPIENVITAHLNTWNAPAGADRDSSIATTYSSTVFVGEPEAAHRGLAGMSAVIAALQAQLPGTVIRRSGPIQTAQDLVTYRWTLGVEGQEPIVSGRNVLQITSLYVLIDTAPSPPLGATGRQAVKLDLTRAGRLDRFGSDAASTDRGTARLTRPDRR